MQTSRLKKVIRFQKLFLFVICSAALLFQATVANASTDPVFKSISVDKKTVKAGESFNVELTVSKGSANLTRGAVIWISESEREIFADLSLDNKTGKLTGVGEVNLYSEPGTWTCGFIGYADDSGKYYSVMSDTVTDLSAADFVVENKTPDLKEPEFISINVSPKTAKPGDVVNVSLMARDDLSGLDYAYIEWESEYSAFTCDLSYNKKKRILEGSILLPDEAEEGEIEIFSMDIGDAAGNTFTYYSPSSFSDTETLDEEYSDESIKIRKRLIKASSKTKSDEDLDFEEDDSMESDLDLSAGAIIVKGKI
ncbi:MAG: hypothetical protein HY779_01685, partial [Rubrobacteridae bacterium]|nr:hypothetical protein [Rubrobacteridae bacterium]